MLAVVGVGSFSSNLLGTSFELTALAQPFVRAYGVPAGLPHTTVQTLLLDPTNRLWIGTQDGLVVFDGKSFTPIPLPSEGRSRFVRSLAHDTSGSLWVGTQAAGLLRRHPGGNWSVYGPGNGGAGPSDPRVNALLADAQSHRLQLWVGTHNSGLWRYDGERWQNWSKTEGLPSERIWDLLLVGETPGERQLWIATDNGPLRLDPSTGAVFRPPGAPEASMSSVAVRRGPEGDAELWFGLYGGGLVGWYGERWHRVSLGTNPTSNFVTDLTASRQVPGELRVATDGGRVFRFDGKRAQPLQIGKRFDSEAIYSVLESIASEGARALWLGTRNFGLLRLVDTEWKPVLAELQMPEASVTSILLREDQPGGPELWLGTDGFGIYRYRFGRWEQLRQSLEGLGSDTVLALAETRFVGRGPRVWVGTRHAGLAEWDGFRWRVHTQENGSLPNNHVQALLETVDSSGRGRLWVGTRSGLAVFDGDRWRLPGPEQGFPTDSIPALLATPAPQGEIDLWLGTSTGLFRVRQDRVVGNWDLADGLPPATIHALQLVETPKTRQLWIGTDGGGVAVLDLHSDGEQLRTLQELGWPTLPNPAVQAMVLDALGNVYLGTYAGVGRIQLQDADPPSRIDWMTFEHGLPSSQVQRGAMTRDRAGRIWVGTAAGSAVFDPKVGFQSEHTLPLFLEAQHATRSGEPDLLAPGETLSHSEGTISLRFRLGSLFGESLTGYRTELVGFDSGPTPWSPVSQRELGPLDAGSYRFRVWARDAWGKNSGPVELVWTVAPRFWETWQARLGQGVVLSLLVALALGVRQRHLRRRQQELEAEVQRRTGELRQANQLLADLSYLDPLTSVPNRRAFEERLDTEWRRAQRTRTPLSLVMIDIDAFKRYNDSQGHLAGDDALVRVSAALKQATTRASDFVARLGGEEFAVILPATDASGALRVAEDLRQHVLSLEIHHPDQPQPGWLTVSCGVAVVQPQLGQAPAELVAAADRALYKAKHAGRNQVVLDQGDRS